MRFLQVLDALGSVDFFSCCNERDVRAMPSESSRSRDEGLSTSCSRSISRLFGTELPGLEVLGQWCFVRCYNDVGVFHGFRQNVSSSPQ